jgi:hypothetical protein
MQVIVTAAILLHDQMRLLQHALDVLRVFEADAVLGAVLSLLRDRNSWVAASGPYEGCAVSHGLRVVLRQTLWPRAHGCGGVRHVRGGR